MTYKINEKEAGKILKEMGTLFELEDDIDSDRIQQSDEKLAEVRNEWKRVHDIAKPFAVKVITAIQVQ